MRILKSLFVLGAGAAMTSGCVAVGAVAAASVGMAGAQDRTYGGP